MLIHAGQDLPLCLHTHVFDKRTGKDLSDFQNNRREGYAFKEWDTVTKHALIHLLGENGQPLIDMQTGESLTKWIHLPYAETVFIIPNKNMIEIVAIKIIMLDTNATTEDLKTKSNFDLLSLMVADAMDEPEATDISFRSATDYDPNAKKKDINDYIEIL